MNRSNDADKINAGCILCELVVLEIVIGVCHSVLPLLFFPFVFFVSVCLFAGGYQFFSFGCVMLRSDLILLPLTNCRDLLS